MPKNLFQKGHKVPKEWIIAHRKATKGSKRPWISKMLKGNKLCLGHKHTEKSIEKMRKAKLNKYVNENSCYWKGENASMPAIHQWVIRKKGHPKCCEKCHKTGEKVKGRWNIQWANKDHAYKRFIVDYIGLCSKCHDDYDITHGLRHYNKLRIKMIKMKKNGK